MNRLSRRGETLAVEHIGADTERLDAAFRLHLRGQFDRLRFVQVDDRRPDPAAARPSTSVLPITPAPPVTTHTRLTRSSNESFMVLAMSCALVIFGASGDLTRRKLIPALYQLHRKRRLPDGIRVVGFSRSKYTHTAWRDALAESTAAAGRQPLRHSVVVRIRTHAALRRR